jgi:hypothetical protein
VTTSTTAQAATSATTTPTPTDPPPRPKEFVFREQRRVHRAKRDPRPTGSNPPTTADPCSQTLSTWHDFALGYQNSARIRWSPRTMSGQPVRRRGWRNAVGPVTSPRTVEATRSDRRMPDPETGFSICKGFSKPPPKPKEQCVRLRTEHACDEPAGGEGPGRRGEGLREGAAQRVRPAQDLAGVGALTIVGMMGGIASGSGGTHRPAAASSEPTGATTQAARVSSAIQSTANTQAPLTNLNNQAPAPAASAVTAGEKNALGRPRTTCPSPPSPAPV